MNKLTRILLFHPPSLTQHFPAETCLDQIKQIKIKQARSHKIEYMSRQTHPKKVNGKTGDYKLHWKKYISKVWTQ